ncbi:MAG TPA: hypothetical protein VMY59_04830 [Candidatus Thermoplasmatota archaeon]|nr:hypothetical protein [Candidatus Thermoplasmatota archaeon]
MEYTRAIYYKDGTSETITPAEEQGIKQRLLAGDKFIEFQGEFISADTVARMGKHHATETINKLEQNEADMELLSSGHQKLYKQKRELIKEKVMKRADREKTKQLPEFDDGPDYYLNEHGEKMYS